MNKEKIAIVGASIAGSVCAIVLERLGFDITIFEKSKGNEVIIDRGAGIWLPKELIQQLIAADFLSKEFTFFDINTRPIYTYDAARDHEQLLTSHPINCAGVNWMSLYQDLKKHRPEHKIIYDTQVTDIEKNHESPALIVNGNQKHAFDYCIFADGIHSLGRKHLFPEMKPSFTDTIIWRGTLNRADAATTIHFAGKGTFYVCERGHLLIYLIPNQGIKDAMQEYKINWLFYERIDNQHELFKNDLEKAKQNVIKGTMSAPYRDYLHTAAKKYFPAFPRNIILATDEPLIQSMHEMLIPNYAVDNMALIGDAAVTLRPHTAIGATKAIQDALALGEQLKISSDVKSALKAWNENRYQFGSAQFKLGQALGKLFVTDMPDWHTISKQQIDALWHETTGNVCWYAVNE